MKFLVFSLCLSVCLVLASNQPPGNKEYFQYGRFTTIFTESKWQSMFLNLLSTKIRKILEPEKEKHILNSQDSGQVEIRVFHSKMILFFISSNRNLFAD
jgi:hypothetical protein